MGTGTLSDITAGLIQLTHINSILAALRGAFVGRGTTGAPESGQDMGTLLYPWGTVFCDSINLDGAAVQNDKLTGVKNRVVSGNVLTTSDLPDIIRATGSAATATVQATATDLELVINAEAVTVTGDISILSLTTAPTSNNTCAVDDATLTDQESSKWTGEDGTTLTIGTVGSEISDRVGMIIALKGATEIMYGVLTSPTTFEKAYRGFFFDDSGDPIERETLADTDTLTLMELGWVFLQSNGSTVEASYLTPLYGGDTPTTDIQGSALADGQYWYDYSDDEWKRYNGAAFVSIDRILIGVVVMDGTNCVASRSVDFGKDFSDYNSAELEIFSVTTVKTKQNENRVSVYGVDVRAKELSWIMPTDIETGSEEANAYYWVYIGDAGELKLSRTKYHYRPDLKGYYHPYNTWRCVGRVKNVTSDFTNIVDLDIWDNRTINSPTINSPTINTPTIDTPVIDDFTDAEHSHSDAAGGGLYQNAVIYRLNTDVTGDDYPLGATGGEWELADDTENESYFGSVLVTESNGTFSFTETGYYKITLYGSGTNLSNGDTVSFTIRSTDDNSTYSYVATSTIDIGTIGGFNSASCVTIIDVESVTLDKFRTEFSTVVNNGVARGNGSSNETHLLIERLGDT